MNQIAKYFLWATLVFFLSCSQNAVDQAEIAQLLEESSVALGSKSAQNVAEIFHKEAQLLPEDQNVRQGRTQIQAHFQGLESINFEENFEIEEVLPAGDLVIVQTLNTGKWSKLDNTESGNFTVKGQMVLKRGDSGELEIFRYMYNSNPTEEVKKN